MSKPGRRAAIITPMSLDPEIASYLKAQRSLPPRSGLTLEQTRARMADSARINGGAPVAIAHVEDLVLPGGVPVRDYQPSPDPHSEPLLVYFHGGRFISGDLDSHDPLCRRLADAAGCRLVA